jgi:hypothetical protein
MNTVKVSKMNNDWEVDVVTYEEVVMHQVGNQMIQLVFADGTTKVLTGFEEVEIIPSEEERAAFVKQTEEAYAAPEEGSEPVE